MRTVSTIEEALRVPGRVSVHACGDVYTVYQDSDDIPVHLFDPSVPEPEPEPSAANESNEI